MKQGVWEILGLIFILAAISVMVRPKSKGPGFVTLFGEGLSSVIQFAAS
jgi:hypothetical protein